MLQRKLLSGISSARHRVADFDATEMHIKAAIVTVSDFIRKLPQVCSASELAFFFVYFG
jgi:hypothetical protein